MKRLLFYLLIALPLATVRVCAQAPDQQYLHIYNLIQEADRLSGSGESTAARAKYLEANAALKKLQTNYPNWNDKVVNFRIRYIEEKVGAIPSRIEPSTMPAKPSDKKPPMAPDERDAQIRSLQEAIQRLESDKTVLQAKLKEALTAQPAAVDPRELAKAEEKIRNVEKEKELLRVTLDQEKMQRAMVAEPAGLETLKINLAEANRQLAEQRETSAALSREKEILEGRLKQLPNDKAIQALRAENEALKRQRTKTPDRESVASKNKMEKELTEAKAALESSGKTMATLREERSSLEKTKADLEKRLARASASVPDKAAAEHIKQLEKERDELQGRLKQAGSQSAKLTNKRDPADKEIASLRARLAGLEAQKLPYSPEELALFKQPTVEPANGAAKPAKESGKHLPVAAASLVAEAESAFRGRNYADAEKKYAEVLKLDESNSGTLENLAAAQLEQKKLGEAEATLKRALAAEPNDTHALTLFGIVKFRQEKFDEAFESLSRSAQLDPENAETQNYLGITLSQKGQRGPAEAALRKAIQLAPSNGSAHNNLAVIYATQQPPFLELARWHYQKALAAGHSKNSDLEKLLDGKIVSGGK